MLLALQPGIQLKGLIGVVSLVSVLVVAIIGGVSRETWERRSAGDLAQVNSYPASTVNDIRARGNRASAKTAG